MTKSLPSKNFVLYADDDLDDLELVRDAFNVYSHHIELKTFTDGLELLNYVKNERSSEHLPCLIILDINMPRMDGKKVLRELRSMKDYNDLPIVLFSTSTLPSEIAFAKSFDADFITKPLYTEQIYQLVDRMLKHCSDDVKKNWKQRRS